MFYLQQLIKHRLFLLSLVSFLAIPVYAKNESASVVFVEFIPESESSVSYRMMYLSADGKKRELPVTLQEPADFIQCNNGMVTYFDRKGGIWDIAPQNTDPLLLARTTFSTREDVIGKVLLRREEKLFYAVNNSDPGSKKVSNNYFQVKVFHFDGREEVIVSENGRAYAIYDLSPNVLEVVSSNGLLQIDILTKKTTRIIPYISEHLPHIALTRGAYSMFSRDGGKLIHVRRRRRYTHVIRAQTPASSHFLRRTRSVLGLTTTSRIRLPRHRIRSAFNLPSHQHWYPMSHPVSVWLRNCIPLRQAKTVYFTDCASDWPCI